VLKKPVELFCVQRIPVFPGHGKHFWRGRKIHFLISDGFPVPGADILADVAAEDAVGKASLKFLADRTLVLDGQVSNTASGVQDARESGRGESLWNGKSIMI
jgi:hypothetical protein